MNITTKFSIGDRVFGIFNGMREVKKPCPFCEGFGDITGANGARGRCPVCYGNRETVTWEPKMWRVNRALTIGQVRAYVGGETKTEYMAVETGIGSGTLHRESDLFATEAEALAECEARNAVMVAVSD